MVTYIHRPCCTNYNGRPIWLTNYNFCNQRPGPQLDPNANVVHNHSDCVILDDVSSSRCPVFSGVPQGTALGHLYK